MVQRVPATPRHAPSSMVSKEDEGPQVRELLRIARRTRAEDETTCEVILERGGGLGNGAGHVPTKPVLLPTPPSDRRVFMYLSISQHFQEARHCTP